ncbi:MAG: TRAP transporter small permease [Rhodospirillaceae bacterium]|nr:TRAP transporter small permease [Rhodospirillaceae bacterium]MBT7954935.1 TRAP transporter small permease [Rhodospirillaceae bacterium]
MAEQAEIDARPTDPVGRVLYKISRVVAIVGGLLLSGLALLTTISITGRATTIGPIPGDFELIAIGTGICVFCFLPYCQLMRGNVIVDFFMEKAPTRAKTFMDFIGGVVYLTLGYMLTWRMVYGGFDMYENNEMSMTIGFPRWTTFPISILLMSYLVIVIIYTTWRSFRETVAGEYFNEQ